MSGSASDASDCDYDSDSAPPPPGTQRANALQSFGKNFKQNRKGKEYMLLAVSEDGEQETQTKSTSTLFFKTAGFKHLGDGCNGGAEYLLSEVRGIQHPPLKINIREGRLQLYIQGQEADAAGWHKISLDYTPSDLNDEVLIEVMGYMATELGVLPESFLPESPAMYDVTRRIAASFSFAINGGGVRVRGSGDAAALDAHVHEHEVAAGGDGGDPHPDPDVDVDVDADADGGRDGDAEKSITMKKRIVELQKQLEKTKKTLKRKLKTIRGLKDDIAVKTESCKLKTKLLAIYERRTTTSASARRIPKSKSRGCFEETDSSDDSITSNSNTDSDDDDTDTAACIRMCVKHARQKTKPKRK